MEIDPQVKEVLNTMIWTEDGKTTQFDSEIDLVLRDKVDKFLFSIGGIWKGGVKAHVFQDDPRELIGLNPAKDTGFTISNGLIEQMIAKVGLSKTMDVFVPAGAPAVASRVAPKCATMFCVETDRRKAERLRLEGFNCRTADFVLYKFDIPYSRVIVAAPMDLASLQHALEFVRKNGSLVAVVTDETLDSKDFQDWFKKVKGSNEYYDKPNQTAVHIIWIEKKGRK